VLYMLSNLAKRIQEYRCCQEAKEIRV